MSFHITSIEKLLFNPFTAIGGGALLTARAENKINMMTISWGNMGVMWNKNIVTVYVRPDRYTQEFLEKQDFFSVSFYPKDNNSALKLCGTQSGRDTDKVKATGLTPICTDDTAYFAEAKLVFICKKLYVDRIRPDGFISSDGDVHYPQKDYHYLYMGEIVKVLEAE
jgi:flavin reductase (DIM6/NTAB) family NADH-FMN oxidoreductase RutF